MIGMLIERCARSGPKKVKKKPITKDSNGSHSNSTLITMIRVN